MRRRNRLSPMDVYVLNIQNKLFQHRDKHLFHSVPSEHGDPSTSRDQLSQDEIELIQSIQHKTTKSNRNNVIRTEAYLSMFLNYPELHWAFLAHAVSRNAGWNMTDLKGDMLPKLLQEQEIQDYFQMLERCNWLIFQDAYPQLLLYGESKKQNKSMFHLLPYFHVSSFMQAVWEWYWEQRQELEEKHLAKILSYALIINEQNYIEQRVVQDAYYQKHVLERFTFLLQSFLHFNHIYFPYAKEGLYTRNERGVSHLKSGPKPKLSLAGTIVTDFTKLSERIKMGKVLYSLLFETGLISVDIQSWLLASQHTGSRVDYWPHIFTGLREGRRKRLETHIFHFKEQHVHQKTPPVYSPPLEDAWSDQEHPAAEKGDWYQGHLIHSWFDIEKDQPHDMTKESMAALNRIEAAIVAKETLT